MQGQPRCRGILTSDSHGCDDIFYVVVGLPSSCAGGERAWNLESGDLDVTATLLLPSQGTIDNSWSCDEPVSL